MEEQEKILERARTPRTLFTLTDPLHPEKGGTLKTEWNKYVEIKAKPAGSLKYIPMRGGQPEWRASEWPVRTDSSRIRPGRIIPQHPYEQVYIKVHTNPSYVTALGLDGRLREYGAPSLDLTKIRGKLKKLKRYKKDAPNQTGHYLVKFDGIEKYMLIDPIYAHIVDENGNIIAMQKRKGTKKSRSKRKRRKSRRTRRERRSFIY